jgi:hypothetical protein
VKGYVIAAASLVLVAAVGVSGLRAQDDADAARKDKKIRKMLKLSGELDAARYGMKNALKNMKSNPNLPAGYAKKFEELANDDFWCDVFGPVYAKHFEESDIDKFIEFYESPAGKKLVQKRVALMKDVQLVSAEAGAKLGVKAVQELMKEKQKAEDDDDDSDTKKKGDEKKPEKKKDDDDE